MDDFRAQYFRNGTAGSSTDEEDDNLVVRSFTDDPEIPLRQIRVRAPEISVQLIEAPANQDHCLTYSEILPILYIHVCV